MEVSLEGMQWDIITISKIEKGVAVIGLKEKLNCGGAVQPAACSEDRLQLQVADEGHLLLYTEGEGFQTVIVPPSGEVTISF